MKRSLQESEATKQKGAQFVDEQGEECDWGTFLQLIKDMTVSKSFIIFLRIFIIIRLLHINMFVVHNVSKSAY